MSAEFPQATIRPLNRRSFAWFIPIATIVLATVLGGLAWSSRGPELLLTANDGHGIRSGDVLSYRGIAVGEVQRVELSDDLGQVELRVRLDPAAESLARAGSRFWIVRPDIGFDGLRGLETLFGGKRLSVLPGDADAPVQHEFVCLDEPPVLTSMGDEALEFVLEAPRRFGLSPGAPLLYRQMQIGSVVGLGLSSDARSVEVRCVVEGSFRELIREDTVFWEAGGFDLDFQLLEGLSIDVESLPALISGGIALATPTRPGASAKTGQRFELAANPEKEWRDWRPSLPIGLSLLPRGTPTPRLLRARLVWEEGFFGRGKSRSGWVLPLANGVIAPADLLTPPEGAKEPALELRGERLPLPNAPEASSAGLARRGLAWPEVVKWPTASIRTMTEPEDCLIVAEPGEAPTAIAASRLRPLEPEESRGRESGGQEPERRPGSWRIDPALSFDDGWHGAVVLAREDGHLVGLLVVEQGRASVLSIEGVL